MNEEQPVAVSSKKLGWLASIFTAIFVIGVVVLVMWLSGGCAARQKTITDLPPGVTQSQVQSWDQAVAALHKVAATTSTLRQLVIAFNRDATYQDPKTGELEKLLPDGAAYAYLIIGIAQVDRAQIDAAEFLKTVPNTWNEDTRAKVRDYINAIAAAVKRITLQGLTGIKSKDAQAQVVALLNDLTAAANLVLALAR